MRLYELKLFVTNHAYAQYCNRVEDITRAALEDKLQSQIDGRDYQRSGAYVHIGGVWFVVEYTDTELRLITCYGQTDIDIPAALEWAKIHKDRIVLHDAE